MTKRYRYAKGGRFKRQEFGDLGLGALREHNKQQIDSLKLQQARSEEYRDDTEQSYKDIGRNEIQNQQILNDLEQKAYNNRVNAIRTRSKREVEALEGKAKEYGKQADFWKDFSTTYSKQYGEAAQEVTNLVERKISDARYEEFKKNGGLQANLEAQTEFETNITNTATNDKIKLRNNSDQNGDSFSIAYQLSKENQSTWPSYSKKIAKDIEDGFDGIEAHLKQLAGNNMNEGNVLRLYEDHIKAVLNQAGVAKGTPGYEKALELARKKGYAQQLVLRNSREINQTIEIVEGYAEVHRSNLSGNPIFSEWDTDMDVNAPVIYQSNSSSFNALVQAFDGGTFKGEYGGPVSRAADRASNLQQASLQAAEYILKTTHFNSFEDFLNATYNLHIPGDKNVSWMKRHGKKNLISLEEMWKEKVNRDNDNAKATADAKKNSIFLSVKERIENPNSVNADGESNYIDLSDNSNNWESRKQVWEIMIANPDNEDLQKLIAPYIIYNPDSRVSTETQYRLASYLGTGDWKGFMTLYGGLSKADKESLEGLRQLKLAKELGAVQVPNVKTQATNIAQEVISNIDKSLKTLDLKSEGTSQAKAFMVQEIFRRFAELTNLDDTDSEYIKNPTRRWEKAVELVTIDVQEGLGVWRRSSIKDNDDNVVDGAVKWTAWVAEPEGEGELMTQEFITKAFHKTSGSYEDFIGALNNPQARDLQGIEGHGTIMTKDEIDIMWKTIMSGNDSIRANANITHIANIFGVSETKVLNDLLNKATNVNPNDEDYVNYVADNEVDLAKRKVENIQGTWAGPGRVGINDYSFVKDWPSYNAFDKVKIGMVADVFTQLGGVPMKPYIRSWWGRKKPNPDYDPKLANPYNLGFLDDFSKETGITPDKIEENGNLYFQNLDVFQYKDTYLQDYWFNPDKNAWVPNAPY